MTPVSTNIKIDPELKEQAQDLFESLGMNLTTAVNIFCGSRCGSRRSRSASGSLSRTQKPCRPSATPAGALG